MKTHIPEYVEVENCEEGCTILCKAFMQEFTFSIYLHFFVEGKGKNTADD